MPTTICASSPAAARRLPLREVPAAFDLGQMIVSCPVCRTRYQVDEGALRGQSGRTVRCAKCGHTWHQTASPEPPEVGDEAKTDGRIEPALEVPPRPAATLEVPPRQRALPEPPRRRSRWGAFRWLVIAILLAVAVLAGIVAARGAVVALWPSAARLYALAGFSAESPGAGLKIEKLAPSRTPTACSSRGISPIAEKRRRMYHGCGSHCATRPKRKYSSRSSTPRNLDWRPERLPISRPRSIIPTMRQRASS